MTKRTAEQLALHHKTQAAKHDRKAKIAANKRAAFLEPIRRKLDTEGEVFLSEILYEAIGEEIDGTPDEARVWPRLTPPGSPCATSPQEVEVEK